MAQFKDGAGRVWRLRVTLGTFVKLERSTGLSFKEIGEMFHSRNIKLSVASELAWLAIDGGNAIELDEFCGAITSGDQMNAMMQAVGEALADFFPKPSPKEEPHAIRGPGATSTK